MSLFNSPSTGPDDDSHLVLLWWMCLIGIAIFNCGILLRSARAFHASNRVAYPPRLRSIRDTQLVMSSIYVYGCAYRSILPTHHTLRRVLIRSNASSGFVGRTVATIAELGAAYQSSLLLYEVGTATNERDALIITTSRIIVPMLTIAEIFSWIACTTTNYAGSIIEEGLWAICALLVASCLAKCLVLYEVGGEQRDFVLRALTLNVAYFAYMISVDVPNYVRGHLDNVARGKSYRTVSDGLASLLSIDEHDLTWSYDDWRYSMCWMTLYFSVACWASIAIVNAPRMDEGLVMGRSKSSLLSNSSSAVTATATATALSTEKKAL
ncbi:hypothetical protein ACHAXA_005468 [Cyclostephanos tholiformis]|uniref:Uncharacterized protein n=1 Tax=Cyclostephanos tholiformis TaxID=382380 RepID=A0ABD3SHI4_9STRA